MVGEESAGKEDEARAWKKRRERACVAAHLEALLPNRVEVLLDHTALHQRAVGGARVQPDANRGVRVREPGRVCGLEALGIVQSDVEGAALRRHVCSLQ